MNTKKINILNYKHDYSHYFEEYNKEWIEKDFALEPKDKHVLENPEEAIIMSGGKILFAELDGSIIGTVALMKISDEIVELTKMAVGRKWQGLGAGRLLCSSAISEAKKMNFKKIILYSNTRLERALELYRKLGFIELPSEDGMYQRANIKMGISLI